MTWSNRRKNHRWCNPRSDCTWRTSDSAQGRIDEKRTKNGAWKQIPIKTLFIYQFWTRFYSIICLWPPANQVVNFSEIPDLMSVTWYYFQICTPGCNPCWTVCLCRNSWLFLGKLHNYVTINRMENSCRTVSYILTSLVVHCPLVWQNGYSRISANAIDHSLCCRYYNFVFYSHIIC